MNWTVGGFSEAGLSVRDADSWADFFCSVGGWEVLHRGETPAGTLAGWPQPRPAQAREVLLGRPGEARGFVRLYRFEGVPETEIRGGAMPWDTGGIFDLDFRVADLGRFHSELSGRGWSGFSSPVEWRFGAATIREWLALGPEAVCLAFMQRLDPPLREDPGPGFGHAFNSTQTVRDMKRAVAFYEHLGFQAFLEHRGPLERGGGRVLGLTADEARTTDVELVILHPRRELDGSIELVALPGRSGSFVGERANPTALGLNLLRFPVRGLDDFIGHLQRRSSPIDHGPVRHTELAPFGAVRMVSLLAPEGAWLEFYELS